MKFRILILFLIGVAGVLSAQTPAFVQIDYMPVKKDGRFIELPWAGGLNSAQFCDADLNNDGRKDLVVYEKTENRLLTLIAVSDGKYEVQRDYAASFPPIEGWVVIKDITCDGIADLFTYGNGSIMVYQGKFVNDTLRFDLLSNGIFYQGFSGLINLYSSFVDKPAIADFDGDGDLDILTFNVTANRILLYKNLVKERGFRCDTIAFKLDDNCWGNVFESGLDTKFDLRDTCQLKFPFPGRFSSLQEEGGSLHAGSSIEAFDISGNGLLDILVGDVTFSFMNYLPNQGTLSAASIIRQDTAFPSYNIPVSTYTFPWSAFIDIDHNGKKDLIVTPFEGFGVDNINNVLLYRNIGTDSVKLEFQTNALFVGDMIEVGENATPCLVDITGNGLKDLLIGGGIRQKDQPPVYRIAYYRNIGFADFPVYQLENDDYLSFTATGLSEPYPAAGDLDGDGKVDVLVGLSDGRVLFYRNQSAGNDFVPASPVLLRSGSTDLDVGQNAAPFVIDMDKDNRRDLVIGERNGNINYYRNTGGTGSNVQFTLVTDSVGRIRTNSQFIPFGSSAPALGDFNGDGKIDLIFGGFDNVLSYVSNIEDSVTQRVSATSIAGPVRIGRNLVPAVSDITADGKLEMMIGTLAGGVYFFSENPPARRPVNVNEQQLAAPIEFLIFPNPNDGNFFIRLKEQTKPLIIYQIIDVTGRLLQTGMLEDQQTAISSKSLSPGMYFLQIMESGRSGAKPFIVK